MSRQTTTFTISYLIQSNETNKLNWLNWGQYCFFPSCVWPPKCWAYFNCQIDQLFSCVPEYRWESCHKWRCMLLFVAWYWAYLALSKVADEVFPMAPNPTPTAKPSVDKIQTRLGGVSSVWFWSVRNAKYRKCYWCVHNTYMVYY